MRAVGLITEYNPFHNGHLHHLRESLRLADGEVSVAVMSGHFLQRGEAALFDKWRRTELALAAGVDLVLELPFPWACNSAPLFARGAVQALNGLGGIDALCFGSEAGELEPLQLCAQLLREHEGTIAERTAQLLRQGISYPVARAEVVAELTDNQYLAGLLAQPNNILGIEYLRALNDTACEIRPLTIQRIGAGYHDRAVVNEIASATGIRHLLQQGQPVAELLPEKVTALMRQWLPAGLIEEDFLFRLLLARINQGADSLRPLYQIGDGLENRLVEVAEQAADYADFVDGVKSRQWTRTRIQRILCYLLNEVQAEQMEAFLEHGPLYLHLLGCSAAGEQFLAYCRRKSELPIASNYSRIYALLKRYYGSGSRLHRVALQLLELELRATRNYTLLMNNWQGGGRNRDFFESVRRAG
ncbi:MAG: nucleotidyltransferase [Desulfuromonas sp.]|nr:MAG: nucleotidyltransferase [Desulfuromonas sp.]